MILVKYLPVPAQRQLRTIWRKYKNGVVNLGDLATTRPINSEWGFKHGLPIDRLYIESYISNNRELIKGAVLGVGDSHYIKKYARHAPHSIDVLNIYEHPDATIIADLCDAPQIPTGKFDLFLFIETLHLIYDFQKALDTTYRILKPGGVVLATFPGITPLKDEQWNESWYWNFTAISAKKIFSEVFPKDSVEVCCYGNVLAATAFLHGLAAEEFDTSQLMETDPMYPVKVCVKATKPK